MEEILERYVGRLAPSPTGALHLGNVRTFMIAWLRARSLGGKVILRIEDLDHPRDKPGAAAAAVEDLRWLGFDWDERFVQSERKSLYREALSALRMHNLVYPCVCSRRDVESAQSAPHAGEQLYYPGTCRNRFADWTEACAALGRTSGRIPCWRFRVESGTRIEFQDAFSGACSQNVSEVLGDFPLARDEGGAGYTLAAVYDDLTMGVTEVVRGDDLLQATPAQLLVARALIDVGALPAVRLPSYCHVPLVVGSDGRRLAKRHGDTRIAALRAAGRSAESVLGYLASSCGWIRSGESVKLAELLPLFNLSTIPKSPFMI